MPNEEEIQKLVEQERLLRQKEELLREKEQMILAKERYAEEQRTKQRKINLPLEPSVNSQQNRLLNQMLKDVAGSAKLVSVYPERPSSPTESTRVQREDAEIIVAELEWLTQQLYKLLGHLKSAPHRFRTHNNKERMANFLQYSHELISVASQQLETNNFGTVDYLRVKHRLREFEMLFSDFI